MKTIISAVMFCLLATGLIGQSTDLKAKYHKVSEDDSHIYVTYYYENGTIAEKGRFLNEQRDGEWISYDRQGNKRSKAVYVNGEKSGTWATWSMSGELISKMIYHKNQLQSITYKTNVEKTAYLD